MQAHSIDRVEAARRVLEDHRHPRAPHGFELAGRRAHQIAPLEQDLATDARAVAEKTQSRKPRHALARARFAHQPDRLADLDREVDAVQGADDALAGVEIDGQAAYVDQRFAHGAQSNCHPERSEGPLGQQERSLASLGMTAGLYLALAIPSLGHAEIAGAEIHLESRRCFPGDVLALGREGRGLVQHRVGGILALADFQHALEHRLAPGEIELGLHGARQRIHLDVGPLLGLLLLTLRSVLADDRAYGIGEARAVRPVAYGALAVILEDLLPVLAHLDLDVEPDAAPHL